MLQRTEKDVLKMTWLEDGCVNVSELSPEQWKDISETAKWLMESNMTSFEYNMLETISQIKNERDYITAIDEFDDTSMSDVYHHSELTEFFDVLDNVIDCALLDKAYALPYMG